MEEHGHDLVVADGAHRVRLILVVWSWSCGCWEKLTDFLDDLLHGIHEVLGVLIEVRVEGTVSWPAEVLEVGAITEKIVVMGHQHWLVGVKSGH